MPRPETTPETRAQVARRSLVRTGVTAAWAVPVVTVAAAAPAFAACSGAANLSGSTHGAATRDGKTVTITITLINGGGTTSGLSLTVSGPDALHTLDQVSAPGWSTNPPAGKANSQSLSTVATSQLGCGMAVYTFTVAMHSNAVNQKLDFVFTDGYSFSVTV